jgi:2'-5' RNA ligase
MSYKIGIGILLPPRVSNLTREVELDVAAQINNFKGLTQPPHITVKRPFELASKSELDSFISTLEEIDHSSLSPMAYTSVDSFPDGSLYLAVDRNDSLRLLHEKLLEHCTAFNIQPDQFEGNAVIFHTTLAMGIPEEDIRHLQPTLQRIASRIGSFSSQYMGIFMYLPENDTWVVIKTISLTKQPLS